MHTETLTNDMTHGLGFQNEKEEKRMENGCTQGWRWLGAGLGWVVKTVVTFLEFCRKDTAASLPDPNPSPAEVVSSARP